MLPTRLLRTRHTSYARYVGPSQAPSPVGPTRKLTPILPHPPSSPPPPVHPSRPFLPPPPSGWQRTLHASPAAWPKELVQGVGTYSRLKNPFRTSTGEGESKEARAARLGEERDQTALQRLNATYVDDVAKAPAQEGQWIAAERWRRSAGGGGLTLVFTHACGLNKEHWHPVIHELLARPPTAPGALYGSGGAKRLPATEVLIDDIWLLDDSHHGASVDLNAGRLGPVHSWGDTARDVLNLVTNVLGTPEVAGSGKAPYALPWSEGRGKRAVGIGHSYGANALVQAANAVPGAFEALFLVEPMVPPRMVNDPAKGYPLTLGATKRRDVWPSRASAAEVREKGFFKTWEDRAFDLWLSHHLVPLDPARPDGPVTLATPTWCEAAVFSDPHATLRGWDALAGLEVPTAFLMAGDEGWMLGEEIAREMVWRPKRARNERFMEDSHLLIQENPKAAADAIWRFLTTLQAGEWDAPE